MAEIDQPCSRNAVASMSSFPVNMKEVPFPEVLVWTPKASGGGPPSMVDSQFTGFSGWGISMSRSGESYVSVVRGTPHPASPIQIRDKSCGGWFLGAEPADSQQADERCRQIR